MSWGNSKVTFDCQCANGVMYGNETLFEFAGTLLSTQKVSGKLLCTMIGKAATWKWYCHFLDHAFCGHRCRSPGCHRDNHSPGKGLEENMSHPSRKIQALTVSRSLRKVSGKSSYSKQRFFKRYPDLPNCPDKAFGFNPGNSLNPDTPGFFPVWLRL